MVWHRGSVTPTDPYLDGIYRWWHLSEPSPELLAAVSDGWLTGKGTAIDIGCGLGIEAAYLASVGWKAVGIDLSEPALQRAENAHYGPQFARADVLRLPFSSSAFDLALDRGCFHYQTPAQWASYAAEVARVLRPNGKLLLRACLNSRGVRNGVTRPQVRAAFADWIVDRLDETELRSDTRTMPALVLRLRLGC